MPARRCAKCEVYDRIAFGGVGRYNEFDQLRIAGVRHAELKGFSYSREDVDGRGLANQYAQILGQVFTHEMKPMEVEILVAEIGLGGGANELYRIQYDGTVVDEQRFTVIGGDSETVHGRVESGYSDDISFDDAIRLAVSALAGDERELSASELEVAVLQASNGRRCFRRVSDDEIAALLA